MTDDTDRAEYHCPHGWETGEPYCPECIAELVRGAEAAEARADRLVKVGSELENAVLLDLDGELGGVNESAKVLDDAVAAWQRAVRADIALSQPVSGAVMLQRMQQKWIDVVRALVDRLADARAHVYRQQYAGKHEQDREDARVLLPVIERQISAARVWVLDAQRWIGAMPTTMGGRSGG